MMGFKLHPSTILSIFVVLGCAQRDCYWPDGSNIDVSLGPNANNYENCHPSEDSHCCSQDDFCLSAGLCYSSMANMVHKSHFECMLLLNVVQLYRGGCTVKDWSNVIACPDWCSDSKFPNPCCCDIDISSSIVYSNLTSNIWHCPFIAPATSPFLACGIYEDHGDYICQNDTNIAGARTVVYQFNSDAPPAPEVLGFPSTVWTQNPPQTPTDGSTTSNAISSSAILTTSSSNLALPSTIKDLPYPPTSAVPLTSASLSPTISHTRSRDTTPMIALGTGIGVPSTIAVLALVAMLYWKRAKQGDRAKKGRRTSNESVERKKRSANHRLGPAEEMEDDQVPWELDHTTGRFEIPTRRL